MGRRANQAHRRQVGKIDHIHPCDGCDKLIKCRTKELACRSYKAYFNKSSSWRDETRAPTSRIFNHIFNAPDDGVVIDLSGTKETLVLRDYCARGEGASSS